MPGRRLLDDDGWAGGQRRHGDAGAVDDCLQALEQQVARLSRAARKSAPATEDDVGDAGTKLRFSAKGLKKQRERLGLSAADVAALIGVSGQSIYKWEDGKTRPRASQLPAIATLRGLSKREAAARLEALRGK